jgi:hypothetical protein
MTPSTRLARWSVLALFVSMLTVTPARAQLGITAGLNFESMDDITTSQNNLRSNFDNSTGYHIGAVYNIGLGPLDLRPGVIFRQVGEYQFEGIQDLEDPNFDVSVIEVPLDLKLQVLPTPIVKPYVLGGPMLSFPSSEGDFDNATKSTSFSLNVGAGLGIAIPGAGFELQPELRYEFGATTFIEDSFTIGSQEFEPQDEPNFSSFSVRLHLLF